MPRRHKPQAHTRYAFTNNEAKKQVFPTEQAATSRAELIMLQRPGVTLHVYTTGADKWYLSSRESSSSNSSTSQN